MEGKSGRSRTHRLGTATAVADPVLVRLKARRTTMILLASDMTHDRAGHIELHGVRFVRAKRNVRDWFAGRAAGTADRVLIKTSGTDRVGIIPRHPYIRVPDDSQGFRLLNLSRQEFLRYHLLSNRRMLRSGIRLERVPSTTVVEKAIAWALRLPRLARDHVAARLFLATA
jgi:hypothetical protein